MYPWCVTSYPPYDFYTETSLLYIMGIYVISYDWRNLVLWILQIGQRCSGTMPISLSCLLNLHSHVPDHHGRQRSRFARKNESWENLVSISNIWLWTNMFWRHQLKKVGHFGLGTMHDAGRHLEIARSRGHTKSGPSEGGQRLRSRPGYDFTRVMVT